MKFTLEDFNPDCEMLGDLRKWEQYLRNLPQASADLYPNETSENARKNVIGMWLYCVAKIRAMEYRQAGYIPIALSLEEECDNIYDHRLPVEIRELLW
jgi:hypothetical protein